MSSIPPDWDQFATKADLAALASDLRGELRSEIGGLRTELHSEIGGLRTELHSEIGGLRAEMHQGFAEVYKAMNAQTWKLMGGVALIMTVVTTVDHMVG